MIFSNIDTIVRRWLLERNLPIHFYAEALFHTSAAVRELSYDTLQIVNAANLPVDDTGSVTLPDDFVDDISVCIPSGDSLSPLPKQDWITPLRLHDTTSGSFVTYPNQTNTTGLPNVYYGFPSQWSYYWNVNDYGESTGRRFGAKGGTGEGYQVFKQMRRIQMTNSLIGTNVVLLYIGDGQSVDNATQVEAMAIKAIQSYIDWQRSPSVAIKNSQEAATFYNEKRRLKTLLNPITKQDVQNTLRQGYSGTLKT